MKKSDEESEKREILDYPNYAIDLIGVWSYNIEDYLTLSKDKDGYLVIGLSNRKGRKTLKLHRLIAQAFIENPLNLPEVDHINREKDDYRIENLRWVTSLQNRANWSQESKDNVSKAARKVLESKSETHKANVIKYLKNKSDTHKANERKVNSKLVKWYHEEFGPVTCSAPDLVRKFPNQKLDRAALSRVAKGKSKTHKGWSGFRI